MALLKQIMCLSLALSFLLLLTANIVESAPVICRGGSNSACNGRAILCPRQCPKRCTVHCNQCKSDCGNCNRPGAVCQDPRFVGGDGVMFYFHGKKNSQFCLVSDSNLHINAHFIGKSKADNTRDFTWIQSLGIMFGKHELFLGARKVSTWNDNVDQLEVTLDGNQIALPTEEGAVWEKAVPEAIKIIRLSDNNHIFVEVAKSFNLNATVVPVTEEDSRVHNYGITSDNCFAHLDINLEFFNLSSVVHGVLGQTYAPGFVNSVNTSVAMPIMGGADKYQVTSLMTPDCKVSKFGSQVPDFQSQLLFHFPVMNCGSGNRGVTCTR